MIKKFYILFNTSSFREHSYSDVLDTPCASRNYGRYKVQWQNTFLLHASVVIVVESVEENSKLVLLLLLGLFLSLSLFPLKSHIFIYTKPFVVCSVLRFLLLWLGAK